MLNSNEYGYAVMNKELTAYTIEDSDLETCKRYCRNGYVVVKRIPYTCGFSFTVNWYKFYKPFGFKFKPYNILWLHFSFSKEKLHKTGEIVYTNNN